MKIKSFIIIACIALSSNLFAQDDAEALAKKLSNPVAALISVPLQNNLDHGIGILKGSRYTLNIQPVIPFSLGPKMNLITRIIVPVVSQYNISGVSSSESGLSDIVASAFISPTEGAGKLIWGVGPVLLIPTGSNEFLSAKKFGVGPTAILLKQTSGWTYGALLNQIWSVAGASDRPDINQLYVNPFISHNWKSGAGITANVDLTQNWTNHTSNIWLSAMFSGLTSFGNQKVSMAIGPRFNLAAPEGVKSSFGLRASLVLLFPK